ncbi:MAG TPA: putative toxin-antitoxin system toxin component, PIN family [Longimicrobiaceae bacterium]|nr:putative toxin-antitoxin system toxin component, PIN family [Longimicrobiaceae bacterium]
MLRAVVDTSVLVSSVIVPRGVPAQVIDAWRANRFVLVTSPPILLETRRTLSYPRIRKKYPFSDTSVNHLLALLEQDAEVTSWEPDVSTARLRDLNDEMVLSCALAGQASFVVSSDQDLLTVGTFRDIRIVTPRQFLAWLVEFERDRGGEAHGP